MATVSRVAAEHPNTMTINLTHLDAMAMLLLYSALALYIVFSNIPPSIAIELKTLLVPDPVQLMRNTAF